MSYNKPTFNQPSTWTQQHSNEMVEDYSAHFTNVLSLNTILANRSGCYATIINAQQVVDEKGTLSLPMDQEVGTANAKSMTETILYNIVSTHATVPMRSK